MLHPNQNLARFGSMSKLSTLFEKKSASIFYLILHVHVHVYHKIVQETHKVIQAVLALLIKIQNIIFTVVTYNLGFYYHKFRKSSQNCEIKTHKMCINALFA